MYRQLRLVLTCLAVTASSRWWNGKTSAEPERTRTFYENYTDWVFNQTFSANTTLSDIFGLSATGWDGWLWTVCDTVIGVLGWLIFGNSWTQVRTGFSLIVRLTVILFVCVAAHYIFALCWPVVSLLMGILLTAFWVVRSLLKCCGRAVYYTQRLCGGVPEAAEAEFFGPDTGEVPETSDLRRLKKGSDGERWILVRRGGLTAIMKVQEASSIRSTGLYITYEPDSLRGDESLLQTLHGSDKVHICRNQSCTEDGQHFKSYAVVKPFCAERFQLAASTRDAQQRGAHLLSWFGRRATRAVQKAKDFASESEPEQVSCDAHRVFWQDETGRQGLCDSRCTELGCSGVTILHEDLPLGADGCSLCPKHAQKYLCGRFQLKCVVAGCTHLGVPTANGLRFCGAHGDAPRSTSTRRSSRSRSRARDPPEGEGDDDEARGGVRRRVRHSEEDEPGDDAESLMREIKDTETPKQGPRQRRRMTEGSPGCTPKSGVQRSLAKLGMINSPDRREFQTTLEEFMERLLDGKMLGLDEEDVRGQMASNYGTSLQELTKMLYEQGVEEQRKGTKGLTKFLGKWRKQLAAETPVRSTASSWSLVGTPSESTTPPVSVHASPEEEPRPGGAIRSAVPERTCVVLGPPGIYGREDRKAGTGSGPEPMAELARAIQQQTSELATLVKAQHESAAGQSGTIKAIAEDV